VVAKMSRQRDIAYGLHSRIPQCCINFYVDIWAPRELWREDRLLARRILGDPVEYVRCPSCLRHNQQANVRWCEAECGRECWREFGE
jgi:hypothetical protein